MAVAKDLFLSNEIHPSLSKEEMAEILDLRQKMAYKTVEDSMTIIYDGVRSGKINQRRFLLICTYMARSLDGIA